MIFYFLFVFKKIFVFFNFEFTIFVMFDAFI